jgi:hypothetical protein
LVTPTLTFATPCHERAKRSDGACVQLKRRMVSLVTILQCRQSLRWCLSVTLMPRSACLTRSAVAVPFCGRGAEDWAAVAKHTRKGTTIYMLPSI